MNKQSNEVTIASNNYLGKTNIYKLLLEWRKSCIDLQDSISKILVDSLVEGYNLQDGLNKVINNIVKVQTFTCLIDAKYFSNKLDLPKLVGEKIIEMSVLSE